MAKVVNNRSAIETDPIRNFRFLVSFKALDQTTSAVANLASATFGFTSVSGLSVSTDSIPYREGGYNTTVHQIPGQTTFAPIQLQRGVTLGSNQNWNWMKQLFQVVNPTSAGAPLATNQFRCDVEIQVLSHPIAGDQPATDPNRTASADHVAMRFNVYNAWITSVAYSDLNAGDNALFVEQMTLVHEGFDLTWAGTLATSADSFDTPAPKVVTPPATK